MNDFLYRYEDRWYAVYVDEWDQSQGSYVRILLYKYPVIKHTPKGAWINIYGVKRFVLASAHKKFACATLEDAITSFTARKNKQIQIYTARIEQAKEALRCVERRAYDT